MSAGSIVLDLLLKTGSFSSDAARSAKDLEKIKKAANDTGKALGDSVKKIAAFAGVTLTIAGITDMVSSAIELRAGLARLSDQSGISVEALGALGKVGKLSGTSLDEITSSTVRLNKSLATQTEDSKGAAQAVAALGLDYDKLKAATPDEQLLQVAKSLAKFEDGAGKSTAAVLLFGKAGATMLPFLKDMAEQVTLVGKVSTESARQAEEFEKNIKKLGKASDDFKYALTESVLPPLLAVTQALADAKSAFGGFITAFAGLNFGQLGKGAGENLAEVNAQIDVFQRKLDETKRNAGKNGFMAGIFGDRGTTDANLKEYQGRLAELGKSAAFFKRQQAREALEPTAGMVLDKFDKKPRLNLSEADADTSAAESDLKKRLEGELKSIRDLTNQQQDALSFSNKYLENEYQEGLSSLESFFKKRQSIREGELAVLLSEQDKIIAAESAFAKNPITKSTDRIDAENRIKEATAQKNRLVIKFSNEEVLALQANAREVRNLRDQYDSLNATIKDLSGDTLGAGQLRIDKEVQDAQRLINQIASLPKAQRLQEGQEAQTLRASNDLERLAPPAQSQALSSELTTAETNQRRFLDLIGKAEGAAYDTIVGGGKFSDYSKHPNTVGLTTAEGPSTAAGKYQITGTTYRSIAPSMGVSDFSPDSQDKIAIGLIARRGAMEAVNSGDFKTAISKLGQEWASLPSSPYSQPKRSKEWVDKELMRQPAEEPVSLKDFQTIGIDPAETAMVRFREVVDGTAVSLGRVGSELTTGDFSRAERRADGASPTAPAGLGVDPLWSQSAQTHQQFADLSRSLAGKPSEPADPGQPVGRLEEGAVAKQLRAGLEGQLKLNEAQKEYNRLIGHTSDAEAALLIDSQAAGKSELDTLSAVGGARQKALAQLGEMVNKANELALSSGTPDAIRFAEQLGLAYKKAAAEVDPLLLKQRELGKELGDTLAHGFEDAIVGGKGLRDIIKGLDQDIVRIITRKMITEPLAKSISDTLGGTGQSGGWIAKIGDFFGLKTAGKDGGGGKQTGEQSVLEMFKPISTSQKEASDSATAFGDSALAATDDIAKMAQAASTSGSALGLLPSIIQAFSSSSLGSSVAGGSGLFGQASNYLFGDSSGGGFFKGLAQGLFGGVGGSAAGTVATDEALALFFHTGGVVGKDTDARSVSGVSWAGAPRYHSGGMAGLAPDEVAAVLRRGEEVLPRFDPRHRDNAGFDGHRGLAAPASDSNGGAVTHNEYRNYSISVPMPPGASRGSGTQFGAEIARQLKLADLRNN